MSDKQLLWDARRLAWFANADAKHVAEPGGGGWIEPWARDFFPDRFVKVRDEEAGRWLWEDVQKLLQDSWQRGFTLEDGIDLISMGVPYNFQDIPHWGRVRQYAGYDERHSVWPYQRAVMFLVMESWRARFCGVCGKRYVADKPARRFCSSQCSAKARQASRSVSWHKHGRKWRAKYEGKKRRVKK